MAETLTQAGLAGLASQMPIRNQVVADQQKAARLLQLQQAVAGMTPQQAPTATQAAGMGATMAAQAGQQQVERAGQQVQQAGQLAKLGQGEAELTSTQKVSALQTGAQREQLDQTSRLAALDDRTKREIFDNELQFKRDQNDVALFSERQLADYKRLNAQKDQDYANWATKAKQVHDRNIATLQAISDRLAEVEKNNYYVGKQRLDQAQTKELAQLKRDNDLRLAKAKAKAANTATMWAAGGGLMTAAGTAAMFVPGGQIVGAGLLGAGALTTAYGSQQAAKEMGEVE